MLLAYIVGVAIGIYIFFGWGTVWLIEGLQYLQDHVGRPVGLTILASVVLGVIALNVLVRRFVRRVAQRFPDDPGREASSRL